MRRPSFFGEALPKQQPLGLSRELSSQSNELGAEVEQVPVEILAA